MCAHTATTTSTTTTTPTATSTTNQYVGDHEDREDHAEDVEEGRDDEMCAGMSEALD